MDLKLIEKIDWSKGLVPTIVQDAGTGAVLMLAYSSQESLAKASAAKRAWFYSRSRKALWEKGATSGNRMKLKSASYDCDGDSLLFQVQVIGKGVACHTGAQTCFDDGALLGKKAAGNGVFEEVFRVIEQRKRDWKKEKASGSYVASIVNDRKEIAAKLREECEELVEAMQKKSKREVAWEAADLMFFSMIALANRGGGLKKVGQMLEARKGKRRKEKLKK